MFPYYVIVRLDSAGLLVWSSDLFRRVGWSDVSEKAVRMIASGDKKSEVRNGGGDLIKNGNFDESEYRIWILRAKGMPEKFIKKIFIRN